MSDYWDKEIIERDREGRWRGRGIEGEEGNDIRDTKESLIDRNVGLCIMLLRVIIGGRECAMLQYPIST